MKAYGVLLSGLGDKDIQDYFIKNAFPTRDEVQKILDALEASNGLSVPDILKKINIRKDRVEKALLLLSLESPPPISKEEKGSKWYRNPVQWQEGWEKFWEMVERLTCIRKKEQREMQKYLDLESGHMEFLIKVLDGHPECIEESDLPPLSAKPNPDLVCQAKQFLRTYKITIEPRKQWPAGGLTKYGVKGKIAEHLRPEVGRALCIIDEGQLGKEVRQGKCNGRFSDELVRECVELMNRPRWPEPTPSWVTCIPSLRHPKLVPECAKLLASELGLPFHPVLTKVKYSAEQMSMHNYIQKARNLDGTLEIVYSTLPSGSVLLIDDIVDSRWTITIASWLLRKHGSGKVVPLALAST